MVKFFSVLQIKASNYYRMKSTNFWIEKLNLAKHPEGGFYKEVYRSEEKLAKSSLPLRYTGERSVATSIYFLLAGNQFSSFHRIQSDETWHFYAGTTLELFVLENQGNLAHFLLGRDPDNCEHLQITIPRNHWFGARVVDKGSFALMGCTVAPGFHFDDFELADRTKLVNEYPQHSEIIKELTFG